MAFGPYSLLLLGAALQGLLLSALLLAGVERHAGSRWLAALVAALALRTAPYILGFAGAYDLHPALTFAPFDFTWAWGPLLWAYVTTLASGTAPPRMTRHLVPVILQVAYQLVCFALPAPLKWDWYTTTHLHVVEPVGAAFALASIGVYAWAAWRVYERWQHWLDENVSNRDESRLGWLRAMLLGMVGAGALGAALTLWHLTVRPLDYFARLPIVLVVAALTYLVGLLGLRYGRGAIAMSAPARVDTVAHANAAPVPPSLDADVAPIASGRGYTVQAEAWRERIVAERWHHDPQLTLDALATRLGTSPRTLSRTLNEGLGVSFNTFVNGLRVADALTRLRQPGAPDVLRVAMDVGFASKASFNRAFKLHTGATPSAVRAEASVQGGVPAMPLSTAQHPPIGAVAPAESPQVP
jgi:AraC-like DNA-binding protein/uncharacterized membrane protein YeaQ/YmgE (transglycosylase-associated protein family)